MQVSSNSTFFSTLWDSVPNIKPALVIVGGTVASFATLFFLSICCAGAINIKASFDPGKKITVYLKMPDQRRTTVPFQVFENNKVAVLDDLFAKKGWTDRTEYNYSFAGRRLEKEKKFSHYGINDHSSIHFSYRQRGD